ncbi:MAG: hypothetical protein WBP59_03715, partial [Ilumatobacteraceae bacterium]
ATPAPTAAADAPTQPDTTPSDAVVDDAATDEASSSTTPAPVTEDTDPPTAPVVVPEALQFSAPLVGGGEFSGADVADKPTVFWFWAPT